MKLFSDFSQAYLLHFLSFSSKFFLISLIKVQNFIQANLRFSTCLLFGWNFLQISFGHLFLKFQKHFSKIISVVPYIFYKFSLNFSFLKQFFYYTQFLEVSQFAIEFFSKFPWNFLNFRFNSCEFFLKFRANLLHISFK